MPHFLDRFVNALRKERDRFKRLLSGEATTEIDKMLREAFSKEWHDLPSPKRKELRVIAVDSGRTLREYASGAFMYICRAAAVSSWGKEYRRVATNFHMITSAREHLNNMVSLRSEHVEHKVAIDALKDFSDVDVVLIDGSLYGRTLHVPISFNYSGERDLYLKYIETFDQLLEECRKRKILLLGVSKDSVASHMTKLLMTNIRTQILENLRQHLSSKYMAQLNENLEAIKQRPYPLMRLVADLPLTDKQRETLRSLVSELRRPRPDFALLSAWAKTAGYTTPIEPYPDIPLYKYEAKDPLRYVQRRFFEAIADYPGKEDAFEKWAPSIMQKAFHLPTFATFCTKLAHNDTPLRVDVPAYIIGLPTRVSDISESRKLDPLPERIEDVLQLLQSEYGGLDQYNVWLVRADQEARLPTRDVTTLYEPLVEKELKVQLKPTRRNRRARYTR
ncbi:MAG: DNA double-strand break repair nuclease NurA [Promethearchaeota archaeon]